MMHTIRFLSRATALHPELIEKIRLGSWNPDGDPEDRQQVAAMAAKGYLEAFRKTKDSVRRVLQGEAAGQVFRQDYPGWYRAMFSESVRAGLLQPYHLAGHRNAPVYIRASRHVPPPPEAVTDAMSALLDLLESESKPIVRAVLGHWLFGFIHPYMDGNGRMARFLMNLMMASGGYRLDDCTDHPTQRLPGRAGSRLRRPEHRALRQVPP